MEQDPRYALAPAQDRAAAEAQGAAEMNAILRGAAGRDPAGPVAHPAVDALQAAEASMDPAANPQANADLGAATDAWRARPAEPPPDFSAGYRAGPQHSHSQMNDLLRASAFGR